jgi:hypothetical protein
VDYSLFMGVMMVLMSERVEKHPGQLRAAFTPPIFARIASISVLRVSPPPLLGNTEVGLYIGVFRSS